MCKRLHIASRANWTTGHDLYPLRRLEVSWHRNGSLVCRVISFCPVRRTMLHHCVSNIFSIVYLLFFCEYQIHSLVLSSIGFAVLH